MRILLCLLLLLLVCGGCSRQDDDPIIRVKSEDAEMNAAIEEAKRTLPVFWKAFDSPASDESEFYLKLAISEGDETEYFWIRNIRKEKDVIFGVVDNKAKLVSNAKFGQQVAIDKSRISDWMFMKAGVTQGGYTIKVLLKRVPESESTGIRKRLGWE